jgi:hypothetical protein
MAMVGDAFAHRHEYCFVETRGCVHIRYGQDYPEERRRWPFH